SLRQRRKVHALERSKEEIQVEETLVFDFLHGLGEAFRETIKPHDLHRLIVEGATRILDAHGGALYLTDRSGNKLVPVFLSKGCPPLVPVPGHILHQAATTPAALEGFLRMHSVPPGEGLIGTVWQTAQPVSLADVRDVPELARLRETPLGTASLMATSLLYGKQNMGVLAVGNGPMGAPFTPSNFVVFKSIAEQSAFALFNAIIYSEANEKQRLDHDLEIVRDIQRILLPEKSPAVPGFEVAVINMPALQASRDYFDYMRVVEHIISPGMFVGIDSGIVFDRITIDFAIRLEQDDCLILYTDGVTEALDAEGFEFGIDRMIQSVRASAAHGASAIITRLIDDVR